MATTTIAGTGLLTVVDSVSRTSYRISRCLRAYRKKQTNREEAAIGTVEVQSVLSYGKSEVRRSSMFHNSFQAVCSTNKFAQMLYCSIIRSASAWLSRRDETICTVRIDYSNMKSFPRCKSFIRISRISIKSNEISFHPNEYLLIRITPSLAISANKRIEFDRLQTSLYAFYLSLRRMLGNSNVTRRYQTLRV